MNDETQKLGDEVLGAYVDGELDSTVRSHVATALSQDVAAQRRLAAIRDVTLLVRAATSAQPAALRRATLPRPQQPSHQPVRAAKHSWADWRLAAAFVVGALAVGVGTQLATENSVAASDWQRSALVFHNTYLHARASDKSHLLIDFGATQNDELASNMTSLVDYAPTFPDLSAHQYAPTGVRLLSSPKGMTMFVVYEAPGLSPVGFSMIRSDSGGAGTSASQMLGDVRLVSWSDGGFEYALSSDISADTLSTLAQTAQRSIGGRTSQPTL